MNPLIQYVKDTSRLPIYWTLGQEALIGLPKDQLRYLFIVSHTRSGSSLLSHIVCSHPHIYGTGELGIPYHSPAYLTVAIGKIRRYTGKPNPDTRYIFDKVLHNPLCLPAWLTSREDTRFIFLLRDPKEAIASNILHSLRFTPDLDEAMQRARDYYPKRLRTVREIYDRVDPGRRRLVSYEALLADAEPILAMLSRFLELDPQLSQEYQVTSRTGAKGMSDYTEEIYQGKIVAEKKRNYPFEIPHSIKNEAHSAYVRHLGDLKPD